VRCGVRGYRSDLEAAAPKRQPIIPEYIRAMRSKWEKKSRVTPLIEESGTLYPVSTSFSAVSVKLWLQEGECSNKHCQRSTNWVTQTRAN
jgi:hypothetical protein